jgi:hypothetical protein
MKNILLILAIAFSSASFGQGNLQFNQVITETGNVSQFGNGWVNSGTIMTVPAGKVWKIENVVGNYSSTSVYKYGIVVNGTRVVVENSNGQRTEGPIWLKAGDNLLFTFFNNYGATLNTCDYLMSIIEFNVVP